MVLPLVGDLASRQPPRDGRQSKLVAVIQTHRTRTPDEILLDELIGIDERHISRVGYILPMKLHEPGIFSYAQRCLIGGKSRLVICFDVPRRGIRMSLMYAAHLPKRVVVVDRELVSSAQIRLEWRRLREWAIEGPIRIRDRGDRLSGDIH